MHCPLRQPLHAVGVAAMLLVSAGVASPLRANESPLSTKVSGTIRVSYDDNVYLQSVSPLADRSSWVTTIAPQISTTWRIADGETLKFGYAPEWRRYHEERSEDSIAHRLTSSFSSPLAGSPLDLSANVLAVEGSNTSMRWSGPGGAPATGGAAVRDRRDAAVYRSTIRWTWKHEDWMVRPIGSLYWHDFQSRHLSLAGYQNCVDRNELSAGFDLGHKIQKDLTTFAGYRYGEQDQGRLLAYREEYDNQFHRAFAGLEGKPWKWLQVSAIAGPEFRHYGNRVHASFPDRDRTTLYADGSVTVLVAEGDSLVLSYRKFEQLSSSGCGAFTDVTVDATWRHRFSSGFTLGANVRGYGAKFLRPAVRDDWIISSSVTATFPLTKRCDLEVSFARDDGISRVPATAGREFVRQVTSIGATYRFD